MANQHLQFSIGSTFSAEGFKRAQESVANLNRSTSMAAGAVGQLGSAMGGLDGKAGAAARSITGLLNAAMTLNPVTIAVAAAVAALAYKYNELKKAQEEARKAAEEFTETQSRINEKLADKLVGEAVKRVAELSREFEHVTKNANDLVAAMTSLDRERSNGGIIALQAEKVAAVMEEVTDEARAMTAAEYDLRIATLKAAAARESAQAESHKAHQAVVDEENRIANFAKQRAVIEEEIVNIEKTVAIAKQNNLSSAESGEKKLEQLRAKIADIDTRMAEAKDRVYTLSIQEQAAQQKYNNAVDAAEIEVTAATGKIADLKRKAEEAAAAEEELAKKSDQLARERDAEKKRLETDRDLRNKESEAQRNLNKASQDLADAERALADAIAKYEANYSENRMQEGIFGGRSRKNGMSIPVRIDGAIKADVTAKELEVAMKDGLIKSVRDMDRFTRQRARELDREEQKKWQQLRNEKQRYDALREKNRKFWSKADVDFARKFERLHAAAEAQKKEIEDAKARVAAAKKREQDNHENLEKIRKSLEKLGLK